MTRSRLTKKNVNFVMELRTAQFTIALFTSLLACVGVVVKIIGSLGEGTTLESIFLNVQHVPFQWMDPVGRSGTGAA